ncbi:MAG: imidazole glycerol phosphate synthase subunit HisH [Candidatus Omnitrophica bacterium]|nr:imidazole glycerol phosphate synthase subunit HisH [Candidatus Omnitrophota bacterium]
MIVIVDYGMGNLRSVENALHFLGIKAKVSDSPEIIKKAKKIIFPGVGHFGKTVEELKTRQIFRILKEKIKKGVPYLGICIGMQILFENSEESSGKEGLGIIKGTVKKLRAKNVAIPHMGWNQIKINKLGNEGDLLFRGIKDKSFFYFVHSYYCLPKERKIITSFTDYGVEFASGIHKDNIWALQFHVEKSQSLGLEILDNFIKLC